MNIFDYAMTMEKEGEDLYTEFAKAAPDQGMKTIFTLLAGQEKKHYEIFKKMKQAETPQLGETLFLKDVIGIFA